MNGAVDEFGRALVEIHLRHSRIRRIVSLDAWIDTAFTGELVLPMAVITSLELPSGPILPAILADGSQVELTTYACQIRWFGKWKTVEVTANEGPYPLLGVGLLLRRYLHIDYRARTLSLL